MYPFESIRYARVNFIESGTEGMGEVESFKNRVSDFVLIDDLLSSIDDRTPFVDTLKTLLFSVTLLPSYSI